jgi:tetratricopeptide (TPR) repeat protein
LHLKGTASLPGKVGVALKPLQDSFIKLDQAEQLRQHKKLDRARTICESLVRQYPDYFGALHTLGLIHADNGNYQRALDCLVRATMLNPRSWTTLTALGGVYLALDAKEMAAQALEQARAIKPNDANVLTTLGEIYREEREYELAKDAYAQAVALEPNLVPAVLGLGWICSHIGQNGEAADVFKSLINCGMRSLDTLHALASLPASLLDIDVLSELDKVVCGPSEDKTKFNTTAAFVRAAALDKVGRHAEAWQQLVPANREVFVSKQEALEDAKQRQRANLSWIRGNAIKGGRGNVAEEETVSLFILGPSRAGKTTMEQLVATLDGVKRGYENPIVENAIRRTFQTAALLTSSYLEQLPANLHPLCRDIYLEELARRSGSAKVFTNTHPARIYDAARVIAIFPNVRIVFVKRNMEDILLRIYMRQYNRGNVYSYDLNAAREHVMWYYQMMDVLAEKLSDSVRVIRYEEMVADPAAALQVAADLCGLAMPHDPLPSIGDDRGCAAPYREFMAAGLGG